MHCLTLIKQIKKAMKTVNLEVENIKCAGCETSITKGLMSLDGVLSVVKIDRDKQNIELTITDDCKVEPISEKLKSMGYPAKGDNDWFTHAKSYVSCAIGKVTS
jgi:copper chaperone CopZ